MTKVTTWEDIQVRSLQKMFLIEGYTVERNDDTNSYINAMPGAYNEAVELLSTVNRYIINSIEVECDGTKPVMEVNLDEEETDDGGIFELKPNSIYFQYESSGRTVQYVGSEIIGNTLFLRGDVRGTYKIFYYAYPLEVTNATPDSTDLKIDPDVAALIPLYIASQLYKDDDISVATIYRNEFETGRELLIHERNSNSTARFTCTTGWW